MLAQPTAVMDREVPADVRVAALRPVAELIAKESRTFEEAAALTETGWSETKWALYVLQGRCLDGPKGQRCDVGRNGQPRARGPFQVWGWCKEAWTPADGTQEALAGGTACAIRMLRAQAKLCEGKHPAGRWAGAFAGYAAKSCDWKEGGERAARMAKVLDNIRSARLAELRASAPTK